VAGSWRVRPKNLDDCIDSATCDWQYRSVANGERYGLTELADLAGVTPRTVRYYLGQGLLPAVGQSGPGAKYGPGHLARLRLIRRLQAEHLPLAEIRHRLDALGEDEIRDLAGVDAPPPPPDSALDYLRTVLGGSAGRQAPTLSPAILRRSTVPPPLRMMTTAPASSAPDAIAERLGEPNGSTSAMVPAAPLAQPIERSQWERIVLAPDVELHVRRPLTRSQNKGIDRLIAIARELLEEDPS